MTPAVHAARKAKIKHSVHEFKHSPHTDSYGKEAAEALGVNHSQVFKTLVVSLQGRNAQCGIAILPVVKQLDLKSFAALFESKKASMTDAKEAERITGYILGIERIFLHPFSWGHNI